MWGALKNAAAIASRAVEETTKQASELLEKLDGAAISQEEDEEENDGVTKIDEQQELNLMGIEINYKESPGDLIVDKVEHEQSEQTKMTATVANEEFAANSSNQNSETLQSRMREEEYEHQMETILDLLKKTQNEVLEKESLIKALQQNSSGT